MRVWRKGEDETEACHGVTQYSREVPAPPTNPVGIIRTPGGPGKGKTHFPGKALSANKTFQNTQQVSITMLGFGNAQTDKTTLSI